LQLIDVQLLCLYAESLRCSPVKVWTKSTVVNKKAGNVFCKKNESHINLQQDSN